MKKIRNGVAALLAAGALIPTACDKSNDIKQDAFLQQALQKQCPEARYAEWERKGSYYVAECRVNGQEKEVWFSGNGEWRMTETDLTWNDLPAAVRDGFAACAYATWQIDDIDMIEAPGCATRYVVEVENRRQEVQLFFTGDGILQETRDVTGRDGSHRPA